MDCEVKYAYHVTNVPVKKEVPHPDWSYLDMGMAHGANFDGPLHALGINGVFLTTTLRKSRKGEFPTGSIYPRNGQSKRRYWRVAVPLTRFNNTRIIRIKEDDDNKTIQMLLLLADNSYSNLIDYILNLKYCYPDVKELTEYYEDGYMLLHRDKETNDWHSNNFNPSDPYWVNIFVPHRVKIDSSDCKWDAVQHY